MNKSRIGLLFFNTIYFVLILTFLIRDGNFLLGIIREDQKMAFFLPSKLKLYGFIFLELCILSSIVFLFVKLNNLSFIIFGTFSIPLFLGLSYLEIKNKFHDYDLNLKHWLIIFTIASIYGLIAKSTHLSSHLKLRVSHYIVLVILCGMAITGYFYIIGRI